MQDTGRLIFRVYTSDADIPVEGAFKYSLMMALAATVIVGGLMAFFPAIVTWLPSMML